MKNEYNIATKKGFEEKDLEDILIISEIKKGDTKAFGKIYDKYYNEILIKMTYLTLLLKKDLKRRKQHLKEKWRITAKKYKAVLIN